MEPLTPAWVCRWTPPGRALATAAPGASGDFARVDLLTALERLKRVVEVTQADLAVDVDASMRARAEAAGAGKRRVGRGIPEQLALARMESPHRAKQHLAINLVVPASTLLDGGNDAGHLDGSGAVPADLARDLVTRALDAPTGDQVGAWLRTVYAGPHGGLVAMDSRSRTVPAGLGVLVRVRDGSICRTPWCDAPIRHTDHAQGAAEGGPTAEPNLQGTCAGCNYAKQAPGWTAAGDHPPGGRHRVVTTTPTGHTHTSTAPPLPGQAPDGHQPEQPEQRVQRVRVLVLELYRGTRIDYTPIA